LAEHEISIRSAKNITNALDRKLFNPILVVISRSGSWYLLDGSVIPEDMLEVYDAPEGSTLCSLMRKSTETVIITENNQTTKIDVAFPVLHGPMGEDGTIQGMFEIMMIPYVGSGVASSAIGMDKDIMKQALINKNIPVTPYITYKKGDQIPSFEEVCSLLGSNSLFIKPASMGSSVGVSKVSDGKEFAKAIEQAFKYSIKILIEKSIKIREIECAVLGNDNPKASCVGEVIPTHEFYSYEAKYLDPNGADIIIPIQNFSEEMSQKIQEISIEAFKACDCRGLARVDFLVSEDNEIYVNELNTIPGFTSISMYPKMWGATGIGYSELITTLIKLGIEEFGTKANLSLVPDSIV
jgi:D-alanine-D-alanine ligase